MTVLCEAKDRLVEGRMKCCPVQSSWLKTEWNPVRGVEGQLSRGMSLSRKQAGRALEAIKPTVQFILRAGRGASAMR